MNAVIIDGQKTVVHFHETFRTVKDFDIISPRSLCHVPITSPLLFYNKFINKSDVYCRYISDKDLCCIYLSIILSAKRFHRLLPSVDNDCCSIWIVPNKIMRMTQPSFFLSYWRTHLLCNSNTHNNGALSAKIHMHSYNTNHGIWLLLFIIRNDWQP